MDHILYSKMKPAQPADTYCTVRRIPALDAAGELSSVRREKVRVTFKPFSSAPVFTYSWAHLKSPLSLSVSLAFSYSPSLSPTSSIVLPVSLPLPLSLSLSLSRSLSQPPSSCLFLWPSSLSHLLVCLIQTIFVSSTPLQSVCLQVYVTFLSLPSLFPVFFSCSL